MVHDVAGYETLAIAYHGIYGWKQVAKSVGLLFTSVAATTALSASW